MRGKWWLAGAGVLAALAIARIQPVQLAPEDPTEPAEAESPGMIATTPHAPLPTLRPAPQLNTEPEAPAPAPPQSAQLPKQNLARVLAAARKDTGVPAAFPLWLTGSMVAGERVFPVKVLYEAGGRHRLELTGGGRAATGFDGRRNWTVSAGETEDSGALIEGRIPILTMWVMTGAWLRPNGPCRVEVIDNPTDRQNIHLSLRSRATAEPARLVLDGRTFRPASLFVGHPVAREIWRFEDYRSALGVTLPYRVTAMRETRKAIYSFTELTPAPSFTRSPFHLALDTPPAVKGSAPVLSEGRRPKPASPESPVITPKAPEPSGPEAMPPCEPQVVEHTPSAPRVPSLRNGDASVARMNMTEPVPAVELGPLPDPEPAPRPVRPDQEKPILNGL